MDTAALVTAPADARLDALEESGQETAGAAIAMQLTVTDAHVDSRATAHYDEAEDIPPEPFLLGTLETVSIRVIRAIPLSVQREAAGDRDSVMVLWEELNQFGSGSTFAEALRDFQDTLAEFYRSLLSEKDKLGKDLRQTLAILSSYLQLDEPTTTAT